MDPRDIVTLEFPNWPAADGSITCQKWRVATLCHLPYFEKMFMGKEGSKWVESDKRVFQMEEEPELFAAVVRRATAPTVEAEIARIADFYGLDPETVKQATPRKVRSLQPKKKFVTFSVEDDGEYLDESASNVVDLLRELPDLKEFIAIKATSSNKALPHSGPCVVINGNSYNINPFTMSDGRTIASMLNQELAKKDPEGGLTFQIVFRQSLIFDEFYVEFTYSHSCVS